MIFVGVNPAFLNAVLIDPGEQAPFSNHPFVDASEYRISPLECSVNTLFWTGSRTKLSTPSLATDQSCLVYVRGTYCVEEGKS
jgi:hypothetical protein